MVTPRGFEPRLTGKKNTSEAAKVTSSENFMNVGKAYTCYPHQDFEINNFFELHVYFMVAWIQKSGQW